MNRVRGQGGRFHTIKEEGDSITIKQEFDVSPVKQDSEKSLVKGRSPEMDDSPVSVEIFLDSQTCLFHKSNLKSIKKLYLIQVI